MHFLTQPPRFLFFTGKGGVGKISIACATAVQLAAQGRRVLIVSTDPASNVGQVFGERIGNRITAIAAVPNLWSIPTPRMAPIRSNCPSRSRRRTCPSWSMRSPPNSPLLRQRARSELREIDAVATRYAQRYAVVPLLTEEPAGVERLRALANRRIS